MKEMKMKKTIIIDRTYIGNEYHQKKIHLFIDKFESHWKEPYTKNQIKIFTGLKTNDKEKQLISLKELLNCDYCNQKKENCTFCETCHSNYCIDCKSTHEMEP